MKRRSPSLLTPGNREWKQLNAEKRELLRPPAGTSTEDLLRQGIQLSAEAARLQAAVAETDGQRPRAT